MKMSEIDEKVIGFNPLRRKGAARCLQPQFDQLTLMLTEVCNLDCWMCDFARSHKLTKVLSLSVAEIIELLQHPIWKKSLNKITLTGGEPFAFPEIGSLVDTVRSDLSHLHINISTNATFMKRMHPILSRHAESNQVTLLVSIDGIAAHDHQRGESGLFQKTNANLEKIRAAYPEIPILIKFTITPINYHELYKTFKYFIDREYVITAKMVENNPNYTSKLSYSENETKFVFSHEMIESIRSQLFNIIDYVGNSKRNQRFYSFQIRELIESLDPEWKRTARCLTPTKGAFIDCDLNVFTCKEYDPILNLNQAPLDDIVRSPGALEILENERHNNSQCRRCTSQMQIRSKGFQWLNYLQFFTR